LTHLKEFSVTFLNRNVKGGVGKNRFLDGSLAQQKPRHLYLLKNFFKFVKASIGAC